MPIPIKFKHTFNNLEIINISKNTNSRNFKSAGKSKNKNSENLSTTHTENDTLIFHTENITFSATVLFSVYLGQQACLLSLRVEDRLDGHSNYNVWKERMQSIFEEAEVWGIMVHT